MISQNTNPLNVAIACGGTGGHLFPGMAVAGRLVARGAAVTLMISPKEVDQLAVKSAGSMNIITLPAVGLTRGRLWAFVRGFRQSYLVARASFRARLPHAALAMGGFTSAPPLLAARRFHAHVFLHESNTIPGRANRWLSWVVDRAFVGFPSAARRLHTRNVTVTGTPVRPNFQPLNPAACRVALGLDPARQVALVMGGSQGARGINELVIRSLPVLAQLGPQWQWFHLSGSADVEKLKQVYTAQGLAAVVRPFFSEMELALGAATAAISRAGASSLAELAAMRVPALLVPFPAATDNHQLHNARAFEQTGAAKLLDQASAQSQDWTAIFRELMADETLRQKMQTSLANWHTPEAADRIAQAILEAVGKRSGWTQSALTTKAPERPFGLLERSRA
jgi:UDP-N-acetylglucosamine--N-acetylmuramyl-(pentapeptide) pyrophosphoryl-undecaprenol N-acetylglucosamine transferase